MGTKMTNAPVYFTLAQVRHNPVLSLESYIPGIQESMRKAGYPDYQKAMAVVLNLGSVAPAAVDAKQEQPQQLRFERYTFSNMERTRGFILDQNSLSFQSTDYDTFEIFSGAFLMGLEIAHKAVSYGFSERIGIRYDSAASVPEPEVAIYINRYKEIIGYSICNDMTARSIEGENPLYLSQAKIYTGSTSLGPNVTPSWLAPKKEDMSIKAKIERGTGIAWQAETSLGALNRTLEDLVTYLFRCQQFPHGAILSTGTGIVPPMDIKLEENDFVEIEVAGVGTLRNQVEIIQA